MKSGDINGLLHLVQEDSNRFDGEHYIRVLEALASTANTQQKRDTLCSDRRFFALMDDTSVKSRSQHFRDRECSRISKALASLDVVHNDFFERVNNNNNHNDHNNNNNHNDHNNNNNHNNHNDHINNNNLEDARKLSTHINNMMKSGDINGLLYIVQEDMHRFDGEHYIRVLEALATTANTQQKRDSICGDRCFLALMVHASAKRSSQYFSNRKCRRISEAIASLNKINNNNYNNNTFSPPAQSVSNFENKTGAQLSVHINNIRTGGNIEDLLHVIHEEGSRFDSEHVSRAFDSLASTANTQQKRDTI